MQPQSARRLNVYDSKHNFDKYRAEYQDKFERLPYISPAHLKRWYEPGTPRSVIEHVFNRDLSRKEKIERTQEERDQALKEVEQFREWAQKTLFSARRGGRCRTIMLVPHGRPGANYRDTKPSRTRYHPRYGSFEPGADGLCWQHGRSNVVSSGPSTAAPALDPVLIVSAMGTPQLLIPSKCPDNVSVAPPSLTHALCHSWAEPIPVQGVGTRGACPHLHDHSRWPSHRFDAARGRATDS